MHCWSYDVCVWRERERERVKSVIVCFSSQCLEYMRTFYSDTTYNFQIVDLVSMGSALSLTFFENCTKNSLLSFHDVSLMFSRHKSNSNNKKHNSLLKKLS